MEKTIGILGGTGSAKSSLVQLLPRLYAATIGPVKVGGVDVRQYDLETLRNQVAVVLQKNVLFSGTIKENLRWGDANASDEELQRACELACADEFIQQMPDKYDTYIEQGGTNVSGGQKQRLCIARAILKDAPIVVLDEASSFADPENEAKIQKAFEALMKGKTVLMIAHRLSTVRNMDRILVIRDGEIAEEGKHDELLEKGGVYAAMWEEYQKAAQWKVGGAA